MARLAAKQEAPGIYTVPGREHVMPVTASITLLQMMRRSVTGKKRPVPAFFASAFAQEHAESKAWRHEQSQTGR